MPRALAVLVLVVSAARGEAWVVQVDGSGRSHRGAAVAIDPTGDPIVGGATQAGSDSGDFTVARLARGDGAERWRTVLGDGRTSSFVAALAIDRGAVLAAGATADGRALVALDAATGAERWRAGSVGPARAVVAAGGNDVVVGGAGGVERLEASGVSEWRAAADVAVAALAVAPSGDVVAAGGDGRRLVVVRLDGASGVERWRRAIPGTAADGDVLPADDAATAVAVGPEGDVYAAGSLANPTDTDGIVLRLDGATGGDVWRTVVAGPRNPTCATCPTTDAFAALALDHAGNPIVTGGTDEQHGDFGPLGGAFTVMKLARADGAIVWRFDTAPRGVESGLALAVDGADDVVAAGTTGTADGCVAHTSPYQVTGCAFTVLKLAAGTGGEVWRRVLPAGSSDVAAAVAIESDGTPVATGTTGRFGAAVGHFTVAALDAQAGGGPDCGNGIVEPGEDCDAIPNPACCTAACRFAPAGTECRAAGDACHPAAVCSGNGAACASVPPPDRDGDGICDAMDPCTGTLTIATPRLVLSRRTAPGASLLALRGSLRLPYPFAPVLDPGTRGVRVLVDDVPLDVPAGAGWRHVRRGWRYASRSGTRAALRPSTRAPGVVLFRFRVRGAILPTPGKPPGSVTVVLDPMGQCGSASFAGPKPACLASPAHGRTVRCR